jgi:Chitin binding Peritrophin-A domain
LWFKNCEYISFEVLIGLVVVATIHAAFANECSETEHSATWPDSNNNQNYYRCVQKKGRWMPQQMHCHPGAVFNHCMNICMWQWLCQMQCCGGIRTPSAAPTPRLPAQLCDIPECHSDQMQIYWPMRNTGAYYECKKWNSPPVERKCAEGTHFDFFQQACMPGESGPNVCPP